MAPQPHRLSDEQLQARVDAYRLYGSQRLAAEALGVGKSAFGDSIKLAAKLGMMGFKPVLDGFEVTSISSKLDADGNVTGQHIQQRQERVFGPFSMPDGHTIKGVSALLDANGNVTAQWVKTGRDGVTLNDLLNAAKEAFEEWVPPAFAVPVPDQTDESRLTIYPIADVHLALKADADESGAEHNLQIGAERFSATTARLFDASPNSDTALILWLGDWTHADDDLAMTPTSKHILQVSDRQLPTIKCGIRLAKDYVYHALRKHRHVIIKVLRGNHDLNSWIALYVALDEHFRDNPRVTVDSGAADYWFFRFGTTLIGAHHGHRLKPAEMAGAMATECREDWGETLYRLFLHGHLHHMIVQEVLGVRVECFRTIAEVDAHHAGKYGSGKSLISITIHKEHGEDGRAQINLPPAIKRAARAL